MGEAKSKKADRFEDSPIAWFGELVLAKDRGDLQRVAIAKAELERLGWLICHRDSDLIPPISVVSERLTRNERERRLLRTLFRLAYESDRARPASQPPSDPEGNVP